MTSFRFECPLIEISPGNLFLQRRDHEPAGSFTRRRQKRKSCFGTLTLISFVEAIPDGNTKPSLLPNSVSRCSVVDI